MIRELINKLSVLLSERHAPSRRQHCAPIKVWFDPDKDTEQAHELARAACVHGETTDFSPNGVGFIVPVIRVKEKYLAGQDLVLNGEIDLPGGKVYLRMKGRRYEKVGIHISIERFEIGAEIISITGSDKEIYDKFLRTRSRRPRGAAQPAGVRLG